MKINRAFWTVVLAGAFFLAAFSSVAAAERSWVKLSYQAGVPRQTRDNVEASLDTIADLLAEYRIYLARPVAIIVTEDSPGYVRALMSYGYTRENAENKAKHTAGISFNQQSVIIIKGSDAFKTSRQEVYRVLPHELFHQVQRQWGRLDTVNWMVEAAPELFQIKAADRAGIVPAAVNLAFQQQRVKKANAIPSASRLGSKDYSVFSGLAAQGYPVYNMSTLMLHKLTEDAGFDKVVYFYQLLHHGAEPEKAFLSVFRVPMPWFLGEMDKYFAGLRQ